MAENHRLRQKATQELLAEHREQLKSLDPDDQADLRSVAEGFDAELDSRGVPLYAEEAFAVLALIEALDAESSSLGDLQESLETMRLAMIQKISDAWAAKDKGFFVN